MSLNDFVRKNSIYNFREPISPSEYRASAPLLQALIETKAFRRLEDVRFLGAIDYVLITSPNGSDRHVRFNRLQHSLGVASLALWYSSIAELSEKEANVVCAAALLHDIGHSPLSHSLEPFFFDYFGLDHHAMTTNIILGTTHLGSEISDILRHFDVNVDRILAILDKLEDSHFGFFSGPINFDTIEGITRTLRYARTKEFLPNPIDIVEASLFRSNVVHKHKVDYFWQLKDMSYRVIINSKIGFSADYLCQLCARENYKLLSREDFLASETQLFKKMPQLRRSLLSRLSDKYSRDTLRYYTKYAIRRFFINEAGDFFDRQDSDRYRQTKLPDIMPPLTAYDPNDDQLLVRIFQ